MPPRNQRLSAPSLLALSALLLALLALAPLGVARASSPEAALRSAWERARALGTYSVRSQMQLTGEPLPTLANVGLGDQEQRFYLSGTVDLPRRAMELKLWSGERDEPIELRAVDGVVSARQPYGEWQRLDGAADLFAPGSDMLGWLVAARNVREAGREQRDGAAVVRYSFDLDGPAFATYMREQTLERLRREGALPVGATIPEAAALVDLSGTGELAVGADGLPVRQELHIRLPDPARPEAAAATIVSEFSGFDAAPALPYAAHRIASADWAGIATSAATLLAGLALALLVARRGRSRRWYAIVALWISVVLLVEPVLQGARVNAFAAGQQERAAAARQAAAGAAALEDTLADLDAPDFDPAVSPLQQAAPAASVTSDDPLAGDSGADADGDGLSDMREEQRLRTDRAKPDSDADGLRDDIEVLELGTVPTNPDTDGDGIPDGVEVEGFVDKANRRWFLDPFAADTNGDGRNDFAECVGTTGGFCPDGDGDGIPDAFDADDDQDQVPDRVDSAPTAFVGAGRDANPADPRALPLAGDSFPFKLAGYEPGRLLNVDFQLRPANPDTLWYDRQVLDWPSDDRSGQVRRVRDTTFGISGKDANGDVRLLPMLEIELRTLQAAASTLPLKPGVGAAPAAPALAGKSTEEQRKALDAWLATWLDRDKLASYNIDVRVKDGNQALIAYVPLTIDRDAVTGDPVAFSARMLYRPAGAFADAQHVRLAWFVEAIQDSCTTPPAASSPEGERFKPGWAGLSDDQRYDAWCAGTANWASSTGPIVSYYDRFLLSGLTVAEDRGATVAVVGQKDAGDNPLFPHRLWGLALNLDRTLIGGSASITTAAVAGKTWPAEWAVPADGMLAASYTFADQGELGRLTVPTADGQEPLLARTLNQFYLSGDSARVATPTLLIARETTDRVATLGENHTSGGAYTASLEGVQPATTAALNLMPYSYKGARTWEVYPQDQFWGVIEPLYAALLKQYRPIADRGDDAVAGAVAVARNVAVGLLKGSSRIVRLDGKPVLPQEQIPAARDLAQPAGAAALLGATVEGITRRVADTQAARSLDGPGGDKALLQAVGARVARGQASEALTMLGAARVAPSSGGDGLITFAAMGALALQLERPPQPALTPAQQLTLAQRTLDIAKTTGMGGLKVYKAVDTSITVWRVAKATEFPLQRLIAVELTEKLSWFKRVIKFAGSPAFGYILAVAVPLGMVAVSLFTGEIRDEAELDSKVADALGQAAVAAFFLFLAITLGPLGAVIGAVIALVDFAIAEICKRAGVTADPNSSSFVKNYVCNGIQGSLAKLVKLLIFSQTSVVQLDAPDRFNPTNWQVQPLDGAGQATGYVQGSTLSIRADVITTLRRNSPGFSIGALYPGSFNDLAVRESTFAYEFDSAQRTGSSQIHTRPSLKPGAMHFDWTKSAGDGDLFSASSRVDSGAMVKIERAGINWRPQNLFLGEGYVVYAQNCWLTQCGLVEQRNTSYLDIGASLVFDTFPPGLGEFANRTPRGDAGGYALSWDPAFPVLKDADGDGLRSRAVGGNDPDDNRPDADGDGLSDFYELQSAARGFKPDQADGDGDGLSDRDEVSYNTDPALADSDNDGLSDGDEVVRVVRGPNGAVAYAGGWEIVYGYDADARPLSVRVGSNPLRADGDEDGILDRQERTYGFNPRVFDKPQVLSIVAALDEGDGLADGVIRGGAAVGLDVRVANELRDRYALSRFEQSFAGASSERSYVLSPRESSDLSAEVPVAALTQSQKLELVARATAVVADLRALADGRVLWLRLDEAAGTTFADDSLLGNTASCVGGACPAVVEDGLVGRARSFAGQSLRVPYRPGLGLSRFSLGMWVRPARADSWQDLVARQKGAGDRFSYVLSIPPNSLAVRVAAQAADCKAGAFDLTSSAQLTPGVWNHVMALYDGAAVRLYVNGELAGERGYSGEICQSDADLIVGAGLRGTALDELSLYPRGLTDAEARAFFRSPVLQLDFDGGIADRSALAQPVQARGLAAPIIAPSRDGESAAAFDKRRWLSVGGASGGQSLNLNTGAGQFTLAGWLRPQPFRRVYDSATERWMGVLGYQSSSADQSAYPGLYVSDTGRLKVEFGNGSARCSSGATGALVKPDLWQHLAVSYSAGRFAFYLDGKLAADLSLSSNCAGNPRPATGTRLDVGRADNTTRVVLERIAVSDEGDGPGNAEYRLTFRDYTYSNNDVAAGELRLDKVLSYDSDAADTLRLTELDSTGDDQLLELAVSNTSATSGKRSDGYSDDGYGSLGWIVENQFFNGDLDDLRIFRYALSPDEAAALAGSRTSRRAVVSLALDEPPAQTRFRDGAGNGAVALCDAADRAACPESGLPGAVGQGLGFDGGDRLTLTSTPAVNAALARAFTASAWVRLDDPAADQKLISKADTAARRGFILGVKGGKVFGELWDAAGNYVSVTGGDVPAKSWAHVAMSASVGGELVISLNGNPVGRASLSSTSRRALGQGRPAVASGRTPTLYADADYAGASLPLTAADGKHNYVGAGFNDKASSARLFGACLRLFDNADYGGASFFSCDDSSWLGDRAQFNDRTSSAVVLRTPAATGAPGEGVAFSQQGAQTVAIDAAGLGNPNFQAITLAVEVRPVITGQDRQTFRWANNLPVMTPLMRRLVDLGNGVELYLLSYRERWRVVAGVSGKLYGAFANEVEASPAAYPATFDGRWHRVVLSYDGRALRLSLDGAELVNNTDAQTLPQLGGQVVLGGCQAGFGWSCFDTFYNGSMRNLALYNRALGAAELETLWARPAEVPPTGRVFHMPLDEAAGSTAFSTFVTNNLGVTSLPLTVGQASWGGFGVRGRIDDVRVSGYVASPAELAALAARGPALSLSLDEAPNVDDDRSPRATSFANGAATAAGSCAAPGCPATGAPGRIRDGAIFDGVDDMVEVPDAAALDLNRYTLALWVRPEGVRPREQPVLAKARADTLQRNYGLFILPNSLRASVSGQFADCTSWFGLDSKRPLNPGQWNHLAATYDNGELRLYINGTLDAAATVTPPAGQSAAKLCQNEQPVRLGREPLAEQTGAPFAGALDEVSILPAPLSAGEIRDLYSYQEAWFDATVRFPVTVDADQPEVSLALEPGAVLARRDTILAIRAVDRTSPVTRVEFDAGAGWQQATRERDSWTFTYTPPAAGAGSATIAVRAFDSVGNSREARSSVRFDSATPSVGLAPSLLDSVLRPVPADAGGWTLRLEGQANDDAGPVHVTAALAGPDGTNVGTPLSLPSVSGAWAGDYRFAAAPSGRYQLRLTARDAAGNVGEARAELLLDAAAPVAEPTVGDATLAGAGGASSPPLPALHGTVADTAAPPHPALALRFEGNALDGSIGQRSAVCAGGACPDFAAPGRVGQAARFAGAQSLRVDAGLRAVAGGRQPFTVAGWLNPAELASGTVLVADRVDGQASAEAVRLELSNGSLVARLAGDEVGRAPVAGGGWRAFALTFDGERARLYLDGAVAAEASRAAPFAGFDRVWLGSSRGAAPFLGAALDELLVYGRALAGAELAAMAGEAGSTVARVQVGLQPLMQNGAPGAISWSDAALAATGRAATTWSAALPAGLEGMFELSLRAADALGNETTWQGVWRGEIDTSAPRVALSVKGAGSPASQASCAAEDLNLDEARVSCPVPASEWTRTRSSPFVLSDRDGKQQPAPERLVRISTATLAVADSAALRLRACDRFGNCAESDGSGPQLALAAAAAEPQAQPEPAGESVVFAPFAGEVFADTAPIELAGYARADAGIRAIKVSVDGSPVADLSFDGSSVEELWTAVYTPTVGGILPVQAAVTAAGGAVFTDTLEPRLLIDLGAPAVRLATTAISRASLTADGRLTLSALLTETVGLASVEAQIDGGEWLPAELEAVAFPASAARVAVSVPTALTGEIEGATAAVALRVTDLAGRTSEARADLPVDTAPPRIVALDLHALIDGVSTPVAADTTITATANPELTLTWRAEDGAGVASYRLEAIHEVSLAPPAVEVITDTVLPASAGRFTLRASEAQSLLFVLSATDSFGNAGLASFGPVTVDSGLTPAYFPYVFKNPAQMVIPEGGAALTYARPYRGFLADGCSAIGAERRLLHAGAPGAAAQNLYATWNEDALRLTWEGGHWDRDGDLFIYLDTRPGQGAADAYNPFGSGAITWPRGFAPDAAVWVSSASTATLLTWDGAAVQLADLESYHFDPSTPAPTTDLAIPFGLLGITDPAAASLGLAAFAVDEGALRPWAALPANNPLGSARAGVAPRDTLAFNSAYSIPSLGAGVCPGAGLYDAADVAVTLEPASPALVRSAVDDPYWAARESDPERAASQLATVKAGATLTYTVRYANRGDGPARGLRAVLPGGATRQLGDLAPGEQGSFTFSWSAPAAGPAATPDGFWAGDHVAIYAAGGSEAQANWIDIVSFEHRVDALPPDGVAVDTPAALRAGPNRITGSADDLSPVPAIELELRGAGQRELAPCADPTPEDRAWVCDLDLAGVTADAVEVRARATDAHGHTSAWSPWQRALVDTTAPGVGFDEATAAALGDGLIGPEEAVLSGRAEDAGGVDEVLVCDETAGVCAAAELEPDVAPATGANWRYALPLPAGDETSAARLKVVAVDRVGNCTPDEGAPRVTATLDAVAPATIVAGAKLLPGGELRIAGSALDGNGVAAMRLVVIQPGGDTVAAAIPLQSAAAGLAGAALQASAWSYAGTLAGAPGTYEVWVEAVDRAGNRTATRAAQLNLGAARVYLPLVARRGTSSATGATGVWLPLVRKR